MGDQIVEVACYSGAFYAERPEAIFWHGNCFSISRCLRSQTTPIGKSFEVILDNGWQVQLQYLNQQDLWTASGLAV
jgi:hypothetical protein